MIHCARLVSRLVKHLHLPAPAWIRVATNARLGHCIWPAVAGIRNVRGQHSAQSDPGDLYAFVIFHVVRVRALPYQVLSRAQITWHVAGRHFLLSLQAGNSQSVLVHFEKCFSSAQALTVVAQDSSAAALAAIIPKPAMPSSCASPRS
jgi:hypothetical protein